MVLLLSLDQHSRDVGTGRSLGATARADVVGTHGLLLVGSTGLSRIIVGRNFGGQGASLTGSTFCNSADVLYSITLGSTAGEPNPHAGIHIQCLYHSVFGTLYMTCIVAMKKAGCRFPLGHAHLDHCATGIDYGPINL